MLITLILRPLEWFGIVGAELRRVTPLSRSVMVGAKAAISRLQVGNTVRSEQVDSQQKDLHELAVLCEQLRHDSLYARYANKKEFRHEDDFWATKDKAVRQYVKQMADRRIVKAVGLADKLDIPILYVEEKREFQIPGGTLGGDQALLHIPNRLKLESSSEVTPVMNFYRYEDGTTYRLQLRIDGKVVERLSAHHLVVLAYNPGMFVLDNSIYTLCEGFSGQLLLPFARKEQVEIPRKMENDYFHRFILKYVTRAEINAEGFDITDVSLQPQACLTAETAINGARLLSLRFKYGNLEYEADSKISGRVTLTETDDSFQFVRQLRNKPVERQLTETLKRVTGADTVIRFPSLGSLIDWLRAYAPRLKKEGFDVVQPSDHLYYIGPLSVEQSDTWHGDWLQTDVTVVIADDGGRKSSGQLRIPFRDLCDTILRGEQEYMLPTGEILLIPNEWLKRYADLMLIGMPKGQGFQRHRSQVRSEKLERRVDASAGMEPAATRPRGADTTAVVSPKLRATLRPYQQAGFQWLWQNFVAQTGCCLSDEMGLEKPRVFDPREQLIDNNK